MHSLILAGGFFLASMTDLYVQALSGAPLPVLGLAIILIRSGRFKSPAFQEMLYLVMLAIGVTVGLYRQWTDISVEIKITNAIGWFVGFFALLVDLEVQPRELERALRIFLLVHVVFFFLQLVIYVVAGFYIDPMLYILGQSSRYGGGTVTERLTPFGIRPTGMFIEPSHYAVHVLPIILVYYFRIKRASLLVWLSVVSVALTFSSWAFVGILVSLVCFIKRRRTETIFAAIIVLFIWVFLTYFMERTFETTYWTGFTPIEQRIEFARMVVARILEGYVGLGIGIEERRFLEFQTNDSGALVFLLYVFGIFGLFFVFVLLLTPATWRSRVVIVLLLTSKLNPAYPLFWLLINLGSHSRDLQHSVPSLRSTLSKKRVLAKGLTPTKVETGLDET